MKEADPTQARPGRRPPGVGSLRAPALTAAYLAVAAVVLATAVQFEVGTVRAFRKAQRFDREHPDWSPRLAAATGLRRPPAEKGAIGRWRRAVVQFWAGRNIYQLSPRNSSQVPTEPVSSARSPDLYGAEHMHPNSPFVVVLLTPLTWLPLWAAALLFNVLKLLALAGAVACSAAVAAHHVRRIAGWVVLLGMLWALPPILGDIQHGNTNIFALAAIAGHLWLYRRGQDGLAGLSLAIAVLLKMTPALFLLYWLYQRNGRLLASALASLVLLGAVLPAGALAVNEGSVPAGIDRYATLTYAWLDNMILPGLARSSWFPEHINQSLSGVVSRYLLAGRDGDIFWGPDDDPYYRSTLHGWITVAALSSDAARWVLRAAQAVIILLTGWAIGWRRLPRADGRRAIHYALVLAAMMLLNQRTWDHHAAVLLPAGVALWQALAFGRMARGVRLCALGLTGAAGLCLLLDRSALWEFAAHWAGRTPEAAKLLADTVRAYGPTFLYFLLLLAAAVILAAALRRRHCPYARERQPLSRRGAAEPPLGAPDEQAVV